MNFPVLVPLPPPTEWHEGHIVITDVDSLNCKIKVHVSGAGISRAEVEGVNFITITLPPGDSVSVYKLDFTIMIAGWSFATPVAQIHAEGVASGVCVDPVTSEFFRLYFYSQPAGGKYIVALGLVQNDSQSGTIWIDDPTFIFKPPDGEV